jgi:hypothetical protein
LTYYATGGQQWMTNNSTATKMLLDASGNLGIGTSSPTDSIGYGRALDIQSATGAALYLRDSDAPTTQYGFIAYDGNDNGLKINNENSSGFIRFNTAGTERIRILSGGNTEIYNSLSVGDTITSNTRLSVKGGDATSSNFGLVVNNNAQLTFAVRNDGLINTGLNTYSPYNFSITGRDVYVNSSGELGYLSSVRESKININNIENVDWLLNLNPVSFNKRKKDEEGNYTDDFYNQLDYGLIAEEAELINEQICFYDETEDGKIIRGVSYSKLITPILKLVQEQQAQIDELKAKILSL